MKGKTRTAGSRGAQRPASRGQGKGISFRSTPRPSRAALRSDLPSTENVRAPQLTGEIAYALARMLMAGIPFQQAVAYFAPDTWAKMQARDRKAWVTRWANDPALTLEMAKLQGAAWHELEPDTRLAFALDKHEAELAYYLYRHNFVQAEDEGVLTKMKEARTHLSAKLAAKEGAGAEAAFKRAIQDIVDGKTGTDRQPGQPPRLGDRLPVKDQN